MTSLTNAYIFTSTSLLTKVSFYFEAYLMQDINIQQKHAPIESVHTPIEEYLHNIHLLSIAARNPSFT